MDTKTFNRRTSNSYHSHARRAREAGQALDYTLDDLRKKVEGQRHCCYCRSDITPANFSCDHSQPTSRGGSFSIGNVDVICTTCNLAKGSLTWNEFGDIVEVMREWQAYVRIEFLARLRRGGKFS